MTTRHDFPIGAAVATGIAVADTLLHELLHAAIVMVTGGRLGNCGLGPFDFRGTHAVTCIAEYGAPGWNSLLTPNIMAAVWVLSVVYSGRIDHRGVRWGVLVGAAGMTLRESLYGAGIWQLPFPSSTVTTDGVRATEAFGVGAPIVGLSLFVAGFWALVSRVEERDTHA